MIPYDKIFGRLGNQMFQGAFLSVKARELGVDKYFQDTKWVDNMGEEVKMFYKMGIEPVDKVAVHIRRGDYVNHPLYHDLTKTDYYTQAMDLFKGEKFLVFSDDILWCKEYFDDSEYDIEYCLEEDPVKALNLMAGCKGVIMANSTFSWWAGWLCEGKVVTPTLWFTNGDRINGKDIWQKI